MNNVQLWTALVGTKIDSNKARVFRDAMVLTGFTVFASEGRETGALV